MKESNFVVSHIWEPAFSTSGSDLSSSTAPVLANFTSQNNNANQNVSCVFSLLLSPASANRWGSQHWESHIMISQEVPQENLNHDDHDPHVKTCIEQRWKRHRVKRIVWTWLLHQKVYYVVKQPLCKCAKKSGQRNSAHRQAALAVYWP